MQALELKVLSVIFMAQDSSTTAQIASAVNQVMFLDPADQTALLDVIEEYFTQPISAGEDSDSSLSEEEDTCETERDYIGV